MDTSERRMILMPLIVFSREVAHRVEVVFTLKVFLIIFAFLGGYK